MNDSSTKIIIFPLKGTRLLKETANSRSGTENKQGKSRISCHIRKGRKLSKTTRVVSNGLRRSRRDSVSINKDNNHGLKYFKYV